ncbi:hypothetical protein B0H10DRAFT_2202528 [Mycena sp. CBHHK59/15]|nr:hypothetical protein B0H10DRAFT_2202528 [Mycena sp. CBHHK59/15]
MPRVAQSASHQHRGTGGMFAPSQPTSGNTESDLNDDADNLWETDTESDTESDDYFEAWEAQPKPRTYDEREERRLEKWEKAAAKHRAVEMQSSLRISEDELSRQLAAIDAAEAPSATSSAPKPPLAASCSIPAPRTVATMFAQQKRAHALSLDDDIEEITSLPGAPLKRIRTDPPARSGEEIELSSSNELADEEC